jgi:hypothetical protein
MKDSPPRANFLYSRAEILCEYFLKKRRREGKKGKGEGEKRGGREGRRGEGKDACKEWA